MLAESASLLNSLASSSFQGEAETKTMPGYEVKFVNPLLKRHECPVCLYAMRNPVQTECGHLFCRECLDPVLKRKRPICPLDKEEINPDSIFPDNACRREILNLEVYCTFMTSGCEWVGPLKNLEVCNCHTILLF